MRRRWREARPSVRDETRARVAGGMRRRGGARGAAVLGPRWGGWWCISCLDMSVPTGAAEDGVCMMALPGGGGGLWRAKGRRGGMLRRLLIGSIAGKSR